MSVGASIKDLQLVQNMAFAALRRAAFSGGPRRLKRVIEYGAALGMSGCERSEAMELIEDAIWADGSLPIDRPSRQAAWSLTLDEAMRAYEDATRAHEEALIVVDLTRYRARRDGREVLDSLPAGASFADLVAEIETRHPLLADGTAGHVAREVLADLSVPPIPQRGPHPTEIFETVTVWPDARAWELHERALLMLDGGIEPDPNDPIDLSDFQPADAEDAPPADVLVKSDSTDVPRHDPQTGTLDLRRRLRTIDFDADAVFQPPAWLVKGILPRQGLGLLYGASGAGKTFLAIHAALTVAWGIPFFGKRAKPGGVLYVAAEGGSSVLPRIRAANAELQPAITAANLSREKGTPPLQRAPLRVITEAPNLSREGDPRPLIATVEDAAADFAADGHRLALVVVDTWHAAMGGGDENSASDAGAALAPLREAAEAHGALVLIIHHPGKDTERGARGSNALPAAVDAIISLTVPGCDGAAARPSTAPRRATITKMRDGEVGAEIHYRLPVKTIGVDEDGEPWTTCVVEPIDAPKLDQDGLTKNVHHIVDAVTRAVAEEGGVAAKLETARLIFYAGRPDAKPASKRQAWGRALKEAREAGQIETDDHDLLIWIPSSPSEA